MTRCTLRFVVFDSNTTPNGQFKVEGNGIVVTGDSDEVATVTVPASAAGTSSNAWQWILWDLDSSTALLHGRFEIRPAKVDYP